MTSVAEQHPALKNASFVQYPFIVLSSDISLTLAPGGPQGDVIFACAKVASGPHYPYAVKKTDERTRHAVGGLPPPLCEVI